VLLPQGFIHLVWAHAAFVWTMVLTWWKCLQACGTAPSVRVRFLLAVRQAIPSYAGIPLLIRHSRGFPGPFQCSPAAFAVCVQRQSLPRLKS